ncbi:hypothetical protein RHGRI_022097 [Rhododendron griersonianum]|uniref:Phosphoribosylformimino-5-aminoimidazole carboxamide ribotide isomerase n=1 Tax=Rhododendron griersonianum TaxID=479676 RepID=A0AAV6JQZ5_9ERIC|nr:hypothetical protein RHGRI_022097 [Rhododendron griersonianum]
MQTYKDIYKEDGLTGGHVIMIGADPLSNSAAMEALQAYPGRQLLLSSYTSSAELAARIDYIQAVFHIGGGINPENALSHIEEGAGHVIIPSYVFNNGQMELQRLKELAHVVGKRRLVLDLSCRKKCKTLKFRHRKHTLNFGWIEPVTAAHGYCGGMECGRRGGGGSSNWRRGRGR